MKGVWRAGSRCPGAALAAACLLASGCAGAQSALDPAGVQADRISRLWWLYFWVCVAVYVLVMLVVVVAVLRRRGASTSEPPSTSPPPDQERRLNRVVTGAVVLTAVALFVLLAGDFLTGRALHSLADPEALVIRVIGHQWWWEFHYLDPTPSNNMATANEIHIPLGRTVQFELQSPDVIHSFWVPNLHGKRDLIPGHPTRTSLRADRLGTFWGQCAEFCGYQHATMRFAVVVEPEEDFRRWLEAQRKSAPEPTSEGQRRGRQVFLTTTCVMCHTVQGTLARATVGPDLTHVAGRQKIASGTFPNTRGHLAGWVLDPQRLRPGVRMPLNPLSPEDLRALLDYLESLK